MNSEVEHHRMKKAWSWSSLYKKKKKKKFILGLLAPSSFQLVVLHIIWGSFCSMKKLIRFVPTASACAWNRCTCNCCKSSSDIVSDYISNSWSSCKFLTSRCCTEKKLEYTNFKCPLLDMMSKCLGLARNPRNVAHTCDRKYKWQSNQQSQRGFLLTAPCQFFMFIVRSKCLKHKVSTTRQHINNQES
jgi:hypothetical protein